MTRSTMIGVMCLNDQPFYFVYRSNPSERLLVTGFISDVITDKVHSSAQADLCYILKTY